MPRFVASDGVGLHYTDAGGNGPAVLCLSGLTRNGSDFDYVAPHLADCRLIRLDYRGRGRSDWAPHATYTIPDEARDALELLDHLRLARAAILGTSRGGLIAMRLAATARDRVLGVCLNDIGPELAPEGLAAIAGYVGRDPAQTTREAAIDARATLMAGFANVSRSRWAEEVARHYVETPTGLTINYDPLLAESLREAQGRPAPDLWPLFDEMEGLPLALIRGANSDLLSAATAEEMQRRRPDMIRADVPDRGHVPFLDEPQAVAAIRTWLKRL